MPITNILKSLFVVAFGAIIGYSSVKLFSQPSENNRGLASMTFSKLGSEQFAKTLFQIKITNESLALKSDQISKIKVNIEAFKAFQSGLSYTWNLPDTVQIVDGNISGDLESFSARETKEIFIQVKGYSKEVRNYISFTVKGSLDGKQIERDVLVSSRPEDSFEYVVQEREKEKAVETKSLLKLGKPAAKSLIDKDKVSF